MSYILDALKKAEQERGGVQLQTVASGDGGQAVHKNRWRPVFIAIAVCAVASACLLWLYAHRAGRSVASYPVAANQTEAHPAAPPAILPAEKQIRHPGSSPSKKDPTASERPVENKKDSSAPKPDPAVSKIPSGPKPADDRSLAPSPPPAVKTESPAPLEEAIKKMTLTVLLYSETPEERMVFINGKKYMERDYVDGYYFVEKIMLEGVELSYKEERLILRP